MQQIPISLRQANATLLGKLLIRRHPDIAEQLLSDYQVERPRCRKEEIPALLASFIRLRSIKPGYITGPTRNRERGRERRLFIAAVLHLCQPQIFHLRTQDIYVQTGLLAQLASALQLNSPRVSSLIREVVTLEKAYEDFRQQVAAIVNAIKGGTAWES